MANGYINIPGGGSASWKQPVPTATSLPALGNTPGDTRVTLDTDVIYIWTGSMWVEASGGGSSYTFADSIVDNSGTVTLVGDSATPGDSKYYGTDSGGSLGYYNLPSSPSSGNLTDAGTDGIVITGGTGAVLGSGTSIAQHVADSSHNGYLDSTDWSTFNSKLTATLASGDIFVGNGSNVAAAVAMSGDATLDNTGAITLATVNSNTGTFASVTVNGKGLATAAAALSGDATTSGSVLTLATVNSNTGTFASVTVNGKGLVTAAAALSGDATTSGSVLTLATVATAGTTGSSSSIPSITINAKGLVTSVSGNAVVAPAGTLTGTSLASNVIQSSLQTVGTLTSGTWDATKIGAPYGGTALDTSSSTGVPVISSGTWSVDSELTVALGGTGQGSALTQYGVIIAASTTAMECTTAGTAGYVLTANSGAAPTFQAPTGSSYTFADSVLNTSGTVTLKGDTASPSASQYYGTNSGSTLGYYNLPSTSGTSTPTANTVSEWDGNVNMSANAFIQAYTTTTLAGAATTLTVTSTQLQYFTGATTSSTCVLPVTSTLVTGQSFTIVCLGAGGITVNSSGGNTLQAMIANTILTATCIAITGTGTASWSWTYTGVDASTLAPVLGGTGLNTHSSTGVPSISSGTWSVNLYLPASLGGTGIATSGSTGVPVISSGTWSVDSALTAALGGTGISTSSSTGVPVISSGTWSVDSALTVALGGTALSSGTSGGILGYTASGTLASSAALTVNQLIIGGGAGATPSTLAAGSQYQSLVMGATTPGYGQVNLAQSAAVTGTLPYNLGGTGQSSAFTQYGVIYATSTSAMACTAAGTAGYVLTANSGSAPTFQAAGGGTTGSYFSGYTVLSSGQGTLFSATSATYATPTISAGNTSLTTLVSAGITVTAGASNVPGITFTPASSSAVYQITASYSCKPAGGYGGSRLYNSTQSAVVGYAPDPYGVGARAAQIQAIVAPASSSAQTFVLQVYGQDNVGGATETDIGTQEINGTSIMWTIIRLV